MHHTNCRPIIWTNWLKF